MDFDLEKVRAQIQLIGHAIKQLDDLGDAIIDARWKFEMVRRDPSLGKTQRGTVTPDEMRKNITGLEEQQKVATDVLKYLAGAETVYGARDTYLRLMTTYQRFGALTELNRSADAGFPAAVEERKKEMGPSGEFATVIADAEGKLAEVAASIQTPAITMLETVNTSIKLS